MKRLYNPILSGDARVIPGVLEARKTYKSDPR